MGSDQERVGLISCGYEYDQWWEDSPPGRLLFGWRRRAVDLAVCNSQGENDLLWWPLFDDSQRGDIVIFSLAPHERIDFSRDLNWLLEMLEIRLKEQAALTGTTPPDAQLYLQHQDFLVSDESGSGIADTIISEGRTFVTPKSGGRLREPIHPVFCDGDEATDACPGPAFQGLGVITRGIRSKDLSEGEVVAEGEIGHVVLFPPSFPAVSSFLGGVSSDDPFWDAGRTMRDRGTDSRSLVRTERNMGPGPGQVERPKSSGQRWLHPNASTSLLDGMLDWAESEESGPEGTDFGTALDLLRRSAAAHRRGEAPGGLEIPPEQYLGEEIAS